MSAFNAQLKVEYLDRVAYVEAAITKLENWLSRMTAEERLSFLKDDPVTYGGDKIVICDEDLILEMEELTRDDDEEEDDG